MGYRIDHILWCSIDTHVIDLLLFIQQFLPAALYLLELNATQILSDREIQIYIWPRI